MIRDVLVKLIGVTPVTNERGVIASRTPTVETPCWACKSSVGRSEFYRAYAAGESVDAIFEVSAIDYREGVHTALECDGVRYDIIRAYRIERDEAVQLSVRRRDI